MKSARQLAFEALLKINKDGAYSSLVVDAALKENPDLDERDKAFMCNLVYGIDKDGETEYPAYQRKRYAYRRADISHG